MFRDPASHSLLLGEVLLRVGVDGNFDCLVEVKMLNGMLEELKS